MVCLKVYYHIKLDFCTTVTACICNILTDMDPRLQIVPNPSFYIVRDIQQSDLVQHSELSAVQDLHIDHQWSRANLL